MLPTPIELDQAHERHEAFAAEALRRTIGRPRLTTLRRAVGHRFIDLGRRIAAEPRPTLASPRWPTTMRG